MHHLFARRSAEVPRRRRVILAILAAGALTLLALGGGTASAASPKSVWLCKPGLASNPCDASLTTTVVQTNGDTSVEHAKRANGPPIDCFYVYPTVSEQTGMNANLEIEPQETQIAIDQASRFSEDCRVYAPVYPQLTLAAINGGPISPGASIKAYEGVAAAFGEYMVKFN